MCVCETGVVCVWVCYCAKKKNPLKKKKKKKKKKMYLPSHTPQKKKQTQKQIKTTVHLISTFQQTLEKERGERNKEVERTEGQGESYGFI